MVTYLQDVPDFSKLKRILLIKLRHLGDVVLSTPVIATLKKRFPHLDIDLVINEEGRELVQGLKELNQVHLYKRSLAKKSLTGKFQAEWGLIKAVRHKRYDAVINLTEGDKGNLLAKFSKAPIRVGKEGSNYAQFLTHRYKKTGLIRHNVERDLDALRRLGIYPQEEEKKLLLPDYQEAERWTDAWLQEKGLTTFYVLHPVSRWLYKSPSYKLFKQVLESIDLPCVITGQWGGNEGRYLDELICSSSRAIYFPSEGSMGRLVSIIKKAEVLVTVDSLPLHLASALKKPTVALFGPTSEADWGPWRNPLARVVHYGQPCRACYKDGCGGGKVSECMEKIDPKEVIGAFQTVFQAGLSLDPLLQPKR